MGPWQALPSYISRGPLSAKSLNSVQLRGGSTAPLPEGEKRAGEFFSGRDMRAVVLGWVGQRGLLPPQRGHAPYPVTESLSGSQAAAAYTPHALPCLQQTAPDQAEGPGTCFGVCQMEV